MKNRKKIILIDIGTHKGQELMSMFSTRFVVKKILIKLIKNIFKIRSSDGKINKNANLFNLFLNNLKFKSLRNKLNLIAVEPNYLLFDNSIYKYVDNVFCLGLSEIKSPELEIKRLFIANNDKLSQGSSIYKNKPNVSINNYKNIICCNPKYFMKQLLGNCVDKNSKVILRLNCEGSEDDIIYSFSSLLGKKLILVLGSLKDVGVVKGKNRLEKLNYFMKQNNIDFCYFSSNINTWNQAHQKILNHLKWYLLKLLKLFLEIIEK